MPKSVRELVSTTMSKTNGASPGLPAFPQLDVEQLARELRLDERAEKAAMAGQPAPDDDGPDSAELDILGRIQGYASKACDDYLALRDLYENRIQGAAVTPDLKVQIEAAGANS